LTTLKSKAFGLEKQPDMLDFLGNEFKQAPIEVRIQQVLKLLDTVIIVGATDIYDNLTNFTDCGGRVDILAPGAQVVGFTLGNVCIDGLAGISSWIY